jgi:hypothetical protein
VAITSIPTYRLQNAIYRRGDLDNPLVYRGVWGPGGLGPGQLVQPSRRAITLRFYDRDGLLVRVLSSNAQQGYFTGIAWDISDTGCGQCDLNVTEDLGLSHDYRLDVHLWNQITPVFSGFLLEQPDEGTTERLFAYSFLGGYYLLDRIYITATYSAQSVYQIVLDLLRQIEGRLPLVRFNQSKIDYIAYNTVGELKFLRMKLTSVLKQLAGLAGGYSWGVDHERELFFRAPSSEVDTHTWVGKHLQTYIPRTSTRDIVNRLFIKGGKVRNDLPTDDPYYKTNWIPDALDDQGPGSSQELYGVREGEYSAPSVLNLVDALVAGQNELNRRKIPRSWATVTGMSFDGTVPSVDGLARIIGRNGVERTFPKKRLRYSVESGRVQVDLELGDFDPTPGDLVGRLAASEASEQLARQQSQQQL